MPETKGVTENSFPDDVRHLKDFPVYDNSLLDGPIFRQKLHTWASRTEKVSIVYCYALCPMQASKYMSERVSVSTYYIVMVLRLPRH